MIDAPAKPEGPVEAKTDVAPGYLVDIFLPATMSLKDVLPTRVHTEDVVMPWEWSKLRAEVKMGALAFVNEARRSLGLEPLDALLPGIRRRPQSCPISTSIAYGARGISVDTGRGRSIITRRHWPGFRTHEATVPSTPLTQQFVSWFDSGRYPELTRAK